MDTDNKLAPVSDVAIACCCLAKYREHVKWLGDIVVNYNTVLCYFWVYKCLSSFRGNVSKDDLKNGY